MSTAVLLCVLAVVTPLSAKYGRDSLVWCTTSPSEQNKCLGLASASQENPVLKYDVRCKQAQDKNQCMNFIDSGVADITSLDSGELVVAGRFHSLVPIVAERYDPSSGAQDGYFSVAVVLAGTKVDDLSELRGKNACFTGVGHMAGWVLPMATLIERNVIRVEDCNNMVKTAAIFFGTSCAPNALIDKYNPTGDNPPEMCGLCAGKLGVKCTGSDPFANHHGAFQCLLNGGQVAFMKHTTVKEMTSAPGYRGPSSASFRLLCPGGGTSPIGRYHECNWGFVPSHTLVVSSVASTEQRRHIQEFMQQLSSFYGKEKTYTTYNSTTAQGHNEVQMGDVYDQSFHLFGRQEKGNETDLLLQDATIQLVPIEGGQQTFARYLGRHLEHIKRLRKCQVPNAKLCITSDKEMEKCSRMKTAFRAQSLKPDLTCVRQKSTIDCIRLVHQLEADLVVLDAGDIYVAGRKYGLIPIIAEQYNLDDPSYYAVAVAKQSDKWTDLLYLKGKMSCHTGVGHGAGWVMPLAFLLSSERMRSYGCDSIHAAAEFFQKSCAPGALYARGSGWSHDNLCGLCHGSSYHFCARDASEPFFGPAGAFRCLVEGGGEIAFVRHTTILEHTGGRNPRFWARNVIPEDFELLCRDGTRAHHDAYRTCNLGRVAANAVVTSSSKPAAVVDAYINLFTYGQQFYGSKYSEDFTFKMFVSEVDYPDLIFQDSTQMLRAVPPEKRNYVDYLGHEFLQAVRLVDCVAAGTPALSPLGLLVLGTVFIHKLSLAAGG